MAAKEATSPQATGPEGSINCTPCSEVERVVVAIKYCVECSIYVCQDCLNDHNKFAALRKHQLVEITEVDEIQDNYSDQSRQVECGSHYGQYLASYCIEHDKLCCSVCVTITHRSCKEVRKIETVAKGIKESQELNNLRSSLELFMEFINNEKDARNQNLKDLTEEKEKLTADVDDYEDKLIQKIRALANTSRENISAAHAKHEKAVMTDVKELDTMMSELKKNLHLINQRDVDERELFIIKRSCETILKEVQKVVTDLSNKWLHTSLFYKFNLRIVSSDIEALGNVVEETKNDSVFRLKFKQSADISYQTDSAISKINGICQLPNRTIVITDANNTCLKRLTDNLEVKDKIDLNDTPECMCVTKPNEVAVVLKDKRLVQFVNIDENMSLGPTFRICNGTSSAIDYDPEQNTIYTCVIENVEAQRKYVVITSYDKKGQKILEYKFESYTEPLKIFLGKDTITVIKNDLQGHTFDKTVENQKPKHKSLAYMYGYERCEYICMLSTKMILSGNKKDIYLCSHDGQKKKNLAIEDTPPILAAPSILAVHFNEEKSTLIVAEESSQIKEYKMGLKILDLLKD